MTQREVLSAAWSSAGAADAYDALRPGYPDAAVDWLLPPGARQVVDLGAGTGKLTRLLVARGLDVTAVDPSEAMLAGLRAAVPGIRGVNGRGENLPLPDASADAVLAAQSWHWVDQEQASAEVARVLRPAGRLGLVWNDDDPASDWLRELSAIKVRASGLWDGLPEIRLGPAFGPVVEEHFPWSTTYSPEQVVALVATRSYVLTATESRRLEILAEVRDLLRTHPQTRGQEALSYDMVASCWSAGLR